MDGSEELNQPNQAFLVISVSRPDIAKTTETPNQTTKPQKRLCWPCTVWRCFSGNYILECSHMWSPQNIFLKFSLPPGAVPSRWVMTTGVMFPWLQLRVQSRCSDLPYIFCWGWPKLFTHAITTSRLKRNDTLGLKHVDCKHLVFTWKLVQGHIKQKQHKIRTRSLTSTNPNQQVKKLKLLP